MHSFHFNMIHHWWRQLTKPSLLEQGTAIPRLADPLLKQPGYVKKCELAQQYRALFRLIDWSAVVGEMPPRAGGRETVPLAAYVGGYLIKLDQGLTTMGKLRRFLVAHPSLVWGLGFLLVPNPALSHGFDAEATLPQRRQWSRVLSEMPNGVVQRLLDETVSQLQGLVGSPFGETVALDTKHIIAWVKENNRKAYIKEGRFDKTQQPAGDADCKLGCKRRSNQVTPTKEGQPATQKASIGEFYWGYASGIVVTKVEGWGEFVLAELTQTFDKGDTTYFFPLMGMVERRLGFRPNYATADAAFDAFYIYDYFDREDGEGFAAIPLNGKGKEGKRLFAPDGLPLCEAGLAMPLKFTYVDRTTNIMPHERAKYGCPLLFPQATGAVCPINHKRWGKGGCLTSLAHSRGARLRHQLDREGVVYQQVYRQRTAVERIFSQAVALGIERPKLRTQSAIANQNSLIYVLLNLRALQRVLAKKGHA
jgi:hypothetical protein